MTVEELTAELAATQWIAKELERYETMAGATWKGAWRRAKEDAWRRIGAIEAAIKNATEKEQPKALQLADDLELFARFNGGGKMDKEAAAELRNLHAELRHLHAENKRLQWDYGRTCKLVADMHGAATGRPGDGPIIGVVEDVAAVREELLRLRAANAELLKVAQQVATHYQASLDWRPPYVKMAHAAIAKTTGEVA